MNKFKNAYKFASVNTFLLKFKFFSLIDVIVKCDNTLGGGERQFYSSSSDLQWFKKTNVCVIKHSFWYYWTAININL